MDAEPPTVLVRRGVGGWYCPVHRAVVWLASQVPLGLPQGDGYSPSTRELGAIPTRVGRAERPGQRACHLRGVFASGRARATTSFHSSSLIDRTSSWHSSSNVACPPASSATAANGTITTSPSVTRSAT